MNAVLDPFRQAQFSMTDFLRQAQGDAVGAFGLDPTESPYRIVANPTMLMKSTRSRHALAI